jgi:hypothetical protein
LTTYTIKCQLVAKENDILNYYTLVFKVLEYNKCPFGHSYVMITVFPNWESRIPELGEVGYLMYDEVIGGQDTYYNRMTDSINKYNFSNLIFKKFVKEVDSCNKNIIID